MSPNPQRRDRRCTKILCTLGPASSNPEVLRRMADAGMNVARLNMSHGTHESHGELICMVEAMNRELEHPISLLLDTQGPEIRTGERLEALSLTSGAEVTLTVDPEAPVQGSWIFVNYPNIVHDLREGDRVTLDNGIINLEVLSTEVTSIRCLVLDGGWLGSRRHVNLPGIHVNLPSITQKDERDIRFGLAHGIDSIALSFVRSADDIRECRRLVDAAGQRAFIYAKIENEEGIRNFDEILDVADGIMVARGDLGVEVDLCELPVHQRRMVRKCIVRGKPVIVATHLLESMIENPMPTRAEVSDVANAVYESADAIMLSGETSAGKYPVRCVQVMDSIARRMERESPIGFHLERTVKTTPEHLAKTACELAESLGSHAIVAANETEGLVEALASSRPRSAIIYAFTKDERVRRMWSGLRSVFSLLASFGERGPESNISQALTQLALRGDLLAGDVVVVVGPIESGERRFDAVRVQTVSLDH